MAINYPYRLTEGTIAYARKVMANFEVLRQYLSVIDVPGVEEKGDLLAILGVLSEGLKNTITAFEQDNAKEIIFNDGGSLQEKYNQGKLNLNYLQTQGGFYFYVNADGHLILVSNTDVSDQDFTIDERGHLIYTVPAVQPGGNVVEYDIGLVRGEGEPGKPGIGNMESSIYDPQNIAKDLNTYEAGVLLLSPDWDTGTKTLTFDLPASDSTKFLEIGLAPTADAAQRKAWRKAEMYAPLDAQSIAGKVKIAADGSIPEVNIPVIVRIKA